MNRSMIIKLTALALCLMVTVIIPFCIWGESMDAFAQHWVDQAHAHPWLSGSVLAGLLVSDIFLPIPSSLVSTACGVALGPVWGTLASTLGMTVSMAMGYGLMRLGSPWMRRKLGDAMPVSSCWWIVALRPVPVLAEASILGAGLLALPFGRVMAVGTLANLLVSAIYAILGAWLDDGMTFMVAFGLAMVFSGLMMWGARNWLPAAQVTKDNKEANHG